jgi:uncharacterized protein YndB with AHSA1/START domain
MDLDPETDLILTRTLNAPRALVWDCWTNPAHLPHWFVPRPHRVVACDLNVRPGGRCNTTFEVEGQLIPNEGVYLEVIEGEKLVFTDTYTEGWKPAPDPFMTAIVTLADTPQGGTTYTAIARHRSAEGARRHAEMGFHDGWGKVARQLDVFAQELAARTMVITREIAAPVSTVWHAWTDPQALPQWWGPAGFTCRTARIDLRAGGEWLLDMIGPDGTVWPNHHRYTRHVPQTRIDYVLLRGEDGPRHADASARFTDLGGRTRVTLSMTMADQAEYDQAMGFGARELGLQTLGKLARFVGAD